MPDVRADVAMGRDAGRHRLGEDHMSARAWRGRKPGPWRQDLRWANANKKAQRSPGRPVRIGGYLIIADEAYIRTEVVV